MWMRWTARLEKSLLISLINDLTELLISDLIFYLSDPILNNYFHRVSCVCNLGPNWHDCSSWLKQHQRLQQPPVTALAVSAKATAPNQPPCKWPLPPYWPLHDDRWAPTLTPLQHMEHSCSPRSAGKSGCTVLRQSQTPTRPSASKLISDVTTSPFHSYRD